MSEQTKPSINGKKFIFRIVILLAVIGIAGGVLRVTGNYLSAFTTEIAVGASMSVMQGNSSTVSGMATQNMSSTVVKTFNTVAWVILFLALFSLAVYVLKNVVLFADHIEKEIEKECQDDTGRKD